MHLATLQINQNDLKKDKTGKLDLLGDKRQKILGGNEQTLGNLVTDRKSDLGWHSIPRSQAGTSPRGVLANLPFFALSKPTILTAGMGCAKKSGERETNLGGG